MTEPESAADLARAILDTEDHPRRLVYAADAVRLARLVLAEASARCTGDSECRAEVHVHGCFAERSTASRHPGVTG